MENFGTRGIGSSTLQGHGMRGIGSGMYSRERHALHLRRSRNAYGCSFENKSSISSCGVVHEYAEDSYGITRVAVHGMNSLCVVTRSEDLLHLIQKEKEARKLICDQTEAVILLIFRNAVVYEVEALAEKIPKPFGVVSLIPGTNMDHKVSRHEITSDDYGERKAMEFLQEEMNSHATFTFIKTVKTTIFALQHLFGKKFKANEIRVFVLKSNSGARIHDKAYELQIHRERSIENLLAVINKPHSGGS